MNCPKCNEPVEEGAAFCGNCGQKLSNDVGATNQHATTPHNVNNPPPPDINQASVQPAVTQQNASQVSNPVEPVQPIQAAAIPPPPVPAAAKVPPPNSVATKPAYAVANPLSHRGDVKALLSLLFGIMGLIGCLFMAFLGLIFGLAGIVMGTMSRRSHKKVLSTIGIVVSIISVLASLATVAYYMDKSNKKADNKPATASNKSVVQVGSELSTPCYSLNLVDRLNIDNGVGSCDMKAYDGDKFEDSTIAYKVYANKSEVTTEAGFYKIAKNGIDKDVATNLKDYKIDSQKTTQFAGSPAYVVKATSPGGNVSIAEAAVFHESKNGNNIFVIVVAKVDSKADMQVIESQWVWK